MKFVINFYRGDVPNGVQGELRLSVDGNTYSKPFDIKANEGNKGKGVQALLNDTGGKNPQSILFEPSTFSPVKH